MEAILNSSMLTELIDLQANRIVFIGIGSSFWIARIAEFLWREYNTRTTITPCSVQSFDLVK
jgi:fructoselysine-6-P-deglycase FrlB-like protein